MNHPDRQPQDSLDLSVEMYKAGRDLNRIYRETAEGGLAKLYE